MSRTVRAASAAMNSRATVKTARRKRSVDRVTGWNRAAPAGQQLDRRQPKYETADVGEVGNAAARARACQPRGAEGNLLGKPEAEHENGRQLDHGDEQDDEDQREHARPWIEQ